MSATSVRFVSAFTLLLALSSSANAQQALQFSDQTDQAGLTSTNEFMFGHLYTPMIGAGLAADFNNDGYDDIFQLGSMLPNNLFINNQDGTFTDHAASWGIDGPFHSFAASAADFNNDGYLDIFITAFGSTDVAPQPGKLLLMKNNGPDKSGQWSFTDVAVSAGVNHLQPGVNSKEGTGSGWGDYDLDGDLDLFVCAYAFTLPTNRLFRNDGPDKNGIWRFTDATAEAGIEQINMSGFIPSFIDMNGDRYPELIIIADQGESKFYVNNHDGTFTDNTSAANTLNQANAMGIDIADINNDQLLDFFVADITYSFTNGPGNRLYIQNPDHTFTDIARSSESYSGYWGWGSLISDFDHDGDKDILETNGFVGGFGGDPVTLFLNDGDGSMFTEAAASCGIANTQQGRGLVRFDTENDGDLDVMIFNWAQPNAYYRNNLITDGVTPGDAHWARIKLDTYARDNLAPHGIGAMLTVSTPGNDYLLPMHNNTTYCGTSPNEVHIGLAEETTINAVRVAWPDGSFNTWTNLSADTVHTLTAPVHPADFDFSNTVDINDIYAFINALGKRSLTADHNGDTNLDFFDISAFLMDYQNAMKP